MTTARIRHGLVAAMMLFWATGLLFAAEVDLRFEQANQAYRASDYPKAAKLYGEILNQGYESAELYYNLGNCHYKMNRVPESILDYERALRLNPDDEDIAHNLMLANLRVVDRVEPIPRLFYVTWWRKCADLASADRWAALAVGFLWLALILCGALFLPYRSFVLPRILSLLALVSVALFVVSLASSIDRRGREQSRGEGIVFAATTSARSAPDPQSTDLFVLHEGVKIQVLDHVGDWTKIRLADGKIGWILTASFQVI